jgi:hypothetical protein
LVDPGPPGLYRFRTQRSRRPPCHQERARPNSSVSAVAVLVTPGKEDGVPAPCFCACTPSFLRPGIGLIAFPRWRGRKEVSSYGSFRSREQFVLLYTM